MTCRYASSFGEYDFVRELVTFTAVAVLVGAANLVATHAATAADLGGVRDRDMGDFREPLPPPVRLTNWTGFYFGGGVGGVMVSAADTEVIPFRGTETINFGNQGLLGTVQGGFDIQFPMSRWVAGVFVDYDWMSVQAERAGNYWRFANGPLFWRNLSVDNEWSAGGRVGYLFSPETLVYGLGAYTSQSITVNGVLIGNMLPFNQSLDAGGWSVGAGLETRLRDNWSLKLEYRYVQSDQWGVAYGHNSASVDESLGAQTARLAITYRIGRW
jgi:outer membrane immunogenic protein